MIKRDCRTPTSEWLFLGLICLVCLLGMALVAIPAHAQNFAYVTNQGSSSVSVINTANNSVMATITLGAIEFELCPTGIAITPDGTRAYVTNQCSDSVPVIDTATNTVVTTVVVGSFPVRVAITPDGTRAYVTKVSTGQSPGSAAVIDTASNTVVATVEVEFCPGGVAITPDGTHAYVTNGCSNSVSVIDTASNTVVATVWVGTSPWRSCDHPGRNPRLCDEWVLQLRLGD